MLIEKVNLSFIMISGVGSGCPGGLVGEGKVVGENMEEELSGSGIMMSSPLPAALVGIGVGSGSCRDFETKAMMEAEPSIAVDV